MKHNQHLAGAAAACLVIPVRRSSHPHAQWLLCFLTQLFMMKGSSALITHPFEHGLAMWHTHTHMHMKYAQS
jgi:hypothetical protein